MTLLKTRFVWAIEPLYPMNRLAGYKVDLIAGSMAFPRME